MILLSLVSFDIRQFIFCVKYSYVKGNQMFILDIGKINIILLFLKNKMITMFETLFGTITKPFVYLLLCLDIFF